MESCLWLIKLGSQYVSSVGSVNFNDLQAETSYSNSRVYAQSKVCLILFTQDLQEQLRGKCKNFSYNTNNSKIFQFKLIIDHF
jgi:hypothetical protein